MDGGGRPRRGLRSAFGTAAPQDPQEGARLDAPLRESPPWDPEEGWAARELAEEDAECRSCVTDGLIREMMEGRGAGSLQELLDAMAVEDVMEEWPDGERPWRAGGGR